MDGRMALARRWDDLVREVRGVPGFSHFQRPLPAAELRGAAVDGPVVAVNVARRRGDALVVSSDEVTPLPLDFGFDDVYEVALAYVQAIERHQSRLMALEEAAAAAQSAPTARAYRDYQRAAAELVEAEEAMESELLTTLAWLWDVIGRPVLDACGLREPPRDGRAFPRLWWCPSGLLSLLPLHAAGRHTDRADAGRSVMDRAVVSYTPSLRALIASRSWERSTAEGAMLHVAMPTTPGQGDLPHVAREEELLAAVFGADRTTLKGPAADRASVMRELARHRCAHFSCHATADALRPASGGLLLSDGLLSVGEITTDHRHRDFAFLSACKTALGGLLLPNESTTLSAALHYTGYRQVIGTLWSVRDSVAADVAEGVYRAMSADGVFDGDRAASALHLVIRGLRDLTPDRPSHWMPFTHTGP